MVKNVAVVGASYVVLIEGNSHFNHLFTFPRFAALNRGGEEKAFVPYTHIFGDACGQILRARALSVAPTEKARGVITLDREVELDGKRSTQIPHDFLVVATGTKLQPPGTLPGETKVEGVKALQDLQDKIRDASKIVLVGGGAVGVQLAFDIAELYPVGHAKSVTLVHSRNQLLNKFHNDLHGLVMKKLESTPVQVKLGSRVKVPSGGFVCSPGAETEVALENGTKLNADLVILCTGQTPQSSLLSSLSPKPILPSGFVKVLNTLQISDPALPHVFAIGDVADSGAPKTARAAFSQVDLVQANILIMIRAEQSGEKEPTLEHYQPPAGGIHLSLGLKESVKFFNPTTPGETPRLIVEEDGTPDMGAGRMWANLAAPTSDYHI